MKFIYKELSGIYFTTHFARFTCPTASRWVPKTGGRRLGKTLQIYNFKARERCTAKLTCREIHVLLANFVLGLVPKQPYITGPYHPTESSLLSRSTNLK